MLCSKAQAGLEYLITYGWALVVVVSIVGVLLFVFNPSIEAEYCRGFDKLLYHEHALSADGELFLILQNIQGGNISNVSVSFGGDFSGTPSIGKSSFVAGERMTISGDTGLSAGQSYSGTVTITFDSEHGFNHLEEATCLGKSEGTDFAVSQVFLGPSQAEGYQDEGSGCRAQEDHLSLVQGLDGQWAVDPSTCGGINYNYYATGTSQSFFDALALKFDVSTYTPDAYDGTLRMYIRDGTYSSNWRHYKVYDAYLDESECYDVGPPCGGSPSFSPGYEGWIEIPLSDSFWDDGELSVRLWDARVDKVELKLERSA